MRNTSTNPIIIFCHLRWQFVFQRPQHIVQRLAKHHDVFFVEEPLPLEDDLAGSLHIKKVADGVTLVQAKCRHEEFQERITSALKSQLISYDQAPILWFYSGAFVDFTDDFQAAAIVYDCMDELSAFKGADPELVRKEKELLNQADIVFTGGKSLYEAKQKVHSNVFCYPSSVDRIHFEKALKGITDIPQDLSQVPEPRVGFYGVLDERLNLSLMADTADAMPQVSFVYIGPVVKINEKDLPQRPNIYYLGSKDYSELPNYLKGFQVAFMPFALNAATRFISPTKTLEFMAAHKPIVSTQIYDVKRDYAREVRLVDTAEEAAAAINHYLLESPAETAARIKLHKEVIRRTSWDQTVANMESHLRQIVAESEETDSLLSATPSINQVDDWTMAPSTTI